MWRWKAKIISEREKKKKQPLQKKRAKKRYLKTVSVPQKLTINKEKLYNRALNEFIYL